MNTGDAEGDLYFDLRSVYMPLECAHPSPYTAVRDLSLCRDGRRFFFSQRRPLPVLLQHDCDNIEVTAPDLAITKLVLEVDSRWSDYGRCNICGPNGEPPSGRCGRRASCAARS